MNNGTSIGLAVIVLAFLGIYMQSKKVLRPSVDILVSPVEGETNMPSLGHIAIAGVGYLAILSLMSPQNGFRLTLLVALGALLIDYQTMDGGDTISTLLG